MTYDLSHLLSPTQAARVLDVSDSYLNYLVQNDRLPCVRTRIGRLFVLEDLEAFKLDYKPRRKSA